jgi:hypothetical protein
LNRIPNFKAPGKQKIVKELSETLDKSLRNVADKYLNGNQSFSLSVDIATIRGMKNAYLGIVASFFDQTDQFRRIALDLCKLSGKHEAAVIKL